MPATTTATTTSSSSTTTTSMNDDRAKTTTTNNHRPGTTTNDMIISRRFYLTAETIISKIFPAGFGWQIMSMITPYSPDTIYFALQTGGGDALGVFLGHVIYHIIKKRNRMIRSSNMMDMNKEIQIGAYLGMAAFGSGTAWQPVVNILQSMNLSFEYVFVGTAISCTTIFYIGMRTFRMLLSDHNRFHHINIPTYHNSHYDGSLALSIGCGTGFFVSTDCVSYSEGGYLLVTLFGISPEWVATTSTLLLPCALAGTCVSIGFLTMQSILNFVYPYGKLWNDE